MTELAHEIAEADAGGHPGLVLTAPATTLQATFVPQAGMICASLTQDGRELLHIGDGLKAWVEHGSTFGIPLLHPWANRLERLAYEAAGRHVLLDPGRMPVKLDERGLPIHGLLHASDRWTVERTSADAGGASIAARYDGAQDRAMMAGFPFPHELELIVSLRHDVLTWDLVLTATGNVPVPVAFGWHPYLRLPGLSRREWHLELPVRRQAMLDARSLPTGQTRPPVLRSGLLGDRVFDDLFPLLDEPAEFVLSGGDGALRVRFDEAYPCAQVYSPPGAEFICFEPMTAPTDALRRGGRVLQLVSPGASVATRWSLMVEGRPGQ